MSSTRSASNGIGIGTLTALAFTILMLTHVIDWSWWWVLSPVWIPIGLGIVVVILGVLIPVACAVVKYLRDRPTLK